jgi:hypothetical protein
MSTSSVDSTPSLLTTLGAQVCTTTPRPFAVSGPRVQALVSELLYSKIQRSRRLTDLRLLKATKDSSSGLLKDHVLLDPTYTATNGSTAVSGYAPYHHLAVGGLRVLATTRGSLALGWGFTRKNFQKSTQYPQECFAKMDQGDEAGCTLPQSNASCLSP